MNKKKGLIIISDLYPKGNGEHFLEKELFYLSKNYDQIYIFPLTTLTNSNNYRVLPDNCEMDLRIASKKKSINYFILWKKSGLLLKILITELIYFKKLKLFLKDSKENLSLLFQNTESAFMLQHFTNEKKRDFHFDYYAVWNDEASLILSILKEDEKIDSFVMRVHGHDLFNERNIHQYLAYKSFKINKCNLVHVLSTEGLNYLIAEGFSPKKLKLSTFGTFNANKILNPLTDDKKFRIVSCSNLIPLKQVTKIAEIIAELNFEIEWVHFGEGAEKNKIESIIQNYKPHQIAILKGDLLNSEIISFYSQNQINLFIHLSESEGLGVALIEAISFGIPVLALNSGGVKDIVNSITGILLPIDSNNKEIVEQIIKFKNSELNQAKSRIDIQNFWFNHFNAEKIYTEFASKMINSASKNS
jgi:glycosyltransferase involved in cell wall biosynthesis